MVTAPVTEELAVTTPVEPPTEATTPLLLLHTPPDGTSDNVVVLLLHKEDVPDIVPADPTFTVVVLLQPVGSV